MPYYLSKRNSLVGELVIHAWASGLIGLAGLVVLYWVLL